MKNEDYVKIMKDLENVIDQYLEKYSGETNKSESIPFTEEEWQNFAKEMGLKGGRCNIGSTDDVDDFFTRLSMD